MEALRPGSPQWQDFDLCFAQGPFQDVCMRNLWPVPRYFRLVRKGMKLHTNRAAP